MENAVHIKKIKQICLKLPTKTEDAKAQRGLMHHVLPSTYDFNFYQPKSGLTMRF